MKNSKSILVIILAILTLTLTYSCKKSNPVAPALVLPPANLAAHWALDGNANDASRYGNNGVAYNTVAAPDRFGNPNGALQFNGSSSYITVPDSVRLRLANTDFTLNAWVKMDAFNSSYASSIISKRITGNNTGWLWAINGVGNEYLGPLGSVYYGPGGGSLDAVSTTALNLNIWTMVTCVYTLPTQSLKIYINGVANNETIGVATPNGAISASLFIGVDTQGQYFFSGSMDDIRIYTNALTQSDISNLYTAKN